MRKTACFRAIRVASTTVSNIGLTASNNFTSFLSFLASSVPSDRGVATAASNLAGNPVVKYNFISGKYSLSALANFLMLSASAIIPFAYAGPPSFFSFFTFSANSKSFILFLTSDKAIISIRNPFHFFTSFMAASSGPAAAAASAPLSLLSSFFGSISVFLFSL